VSDVDHGYADIDDGDTFHLVSASSGAAKVLWKESGTGDKWALVTIGDEAPEAPREIVLTFHGDLNELLNRADVAVDKTALLQLAHREPRRVVHHWISWEGVADGGVGDVDLQPFDVSAHSSTFNAGVPENRAWRVVRIQAWYEDLHDHSVITAGDTTFKLRKREGSDMRADADVDAWDATAATACVLDASQHTDRDGFWEDGDLPLDFELGDTDTYQVIAYENGTTVDSSGYGRYRAVVELEEILDGDEHGWFPVLADGVDVIELKVWMNDAFDGGSVDVYPVSRPAPA
jgi:hypothetical protein